MEKSIFTKLMFACSLVFLLTSCSKEEINTELLQPELSHAEMYLNSHDVPAIMFSYNVLNTDTKVLNSLLIDDEGNIRTSSIESFDVREVSTLSASRLQLMKNESTLLDGQSVTLDELVQNFNLIRTADRIDYDRSIEKEGSQILTASYAYFYSSAAITTTTTSNSTSSSSSSSGECAGGSTTTTRTARNNVSSASFTSILLEQKLAEDIIQKNDKAKYTINWLNNLVNASSMELVDN